MISVVVNIFNSGKNIPVTNTPDVEEFITSAFHNMVDLLGRGYDTLKEPFKGNQDLLIENKNVFVCPIKDKGLNTVGSCFFHFLDVSIYNAMTVIPNTVGDAWNEVIVAIDTTIQKLFPEHFVVHDAINSLKLFLQRFLPLKDPVTEKPTFTSGASSSNSSTSNTKASFYFEPFSDDVIVVKDMCEQQCSSYSTSTENYIFTDVSQQSSSVTTEMTIRDYFFNELKSSNIYICQYEQTSNFGGTWLLFDDSCLCSTACSSTDYFGFTGCADLLNRVGIKCSSQTPCTIESLCPFEETRLTLTSNDGSSKLYEHINSVCLDICAELAGFGDFATLVTIAAASGILPVSNAFGLFGTSFGSPAGVPAALLPGS